MKILFLTTAHNSLSQRLLIELTERNHSVSVAIASSAQSMIDAVGAQRPELIIASQYRWIIPAARCGDGCVRR